MAEVAAPMSDQTAADPVIDHTGPEFLCDRCGAEMIEHNCKVICPNCGNRFDCSDLSLYFD